MLDKLRPRSIYDVMAAVTCFAVLGTGVAYATGTIGSSDIIDESILSQDIKNGQVKRSEIDNNAVIGNKIGDDSVTGADVLESSLGTVPSADTLDGLDSKRFARLGGLVNGDGSINQGSGFTVGHPGDGEYQIAFPSGTLASDGCPPIIAATPFSGLVRHPQLSSRSCSGLGAGSVTLKMLDNDGVAHDTPFVFIAM